MTTPETSRILVDEILKWPTKIKCFKAGSCHLMVEPDEHCRITPEAMEALHAFAYKLGLRRDWFQPSGGEGSLSAHYDLTPSKRVLALRLGAVFVPAREQARRRVALRERLRASVRKVEPQGETL